MEDEMIKRKKSKKKLIVSGVLACIIIAAVLLYLNKDKGGSSEYGEVTAKIGDIETYYSFSGNLESGEEKNITAGSSIKIKEFLVEEGDHVNEGDVLYVVDDSTRSSVKQAEASLELAQINYNNAKNGLASQQLMQVETALNSAKLSYDSAAKNLERFKLLYDEGGISQQSLEQAQQQHDLAKQQYDSALKTYTLTKDTQIDVSIDSAAAQLKQAQAAYEMAQNQVGDIEVKADISGEVAEIYAEEDTMLMAGTKIMDIADYSNMKASIKIDEYDVSSVSLNEEVSVRVDALDKEFKGVISRIAKDIKKDTMSGGSSLNEISYYTAEVDVEKSSELYAGMSVEVKVLNQSAKGVIVLPMAALQFDSENNPYVLCKNGQGKIENHNVKIGINNGETVQITEGLNEGDVVQVKKQIYDPFAAMRTGGERQNE
jgi:RND family efflux transporter MFP subunit